MKRNKIICALLCAALLLAGAGCARTPESAADKSAGGKSAAQSWTEEIVKTQTPYFWLGAPIQLTDNTLCVFVRDAAQDPLAQGAKVHKLTSSDGLNWVEQSCTINSINAQLIVSVSVSPDGDVLAQGLSADKKLSLFYVPDGGAPQELAFDTTHSVFHTDSATQASAQPLQGTQPSALDFRFLNGDVA